MKTYKFTTTSLEKQKDGTFKTKVLHLTTKMKAGCELCYPKGEELGWIGTLLLIHHKGKFILLQSPYHKDEVYTFPAKPLPEPRGNLKKFYKWIEKVDAFKLNLGLEGSYNFVKALIRHKIWEGPGTGNIPYVVYKKVAALVKKWEKKKSG